MVKKFSVNVHYDYVTHVDVIAETEEKALELAKAAASGKDAECFGILDACVSESEEIKYEKFKLVGGSKCKELIAKYPDYKIFWRSGFAYRGAKESEVVKSEFPKECPCYPYWDKQGKWHNTKFMTFEEYMQKEYDWSAAIDINVDHVKKELHFNGFSENDLY